MASPEEGLMARLAAAERRALPKRDFAVPSKAPGPGSYPMPDKKHAAVAKAMDAPHASPKVEAKVDHKANAKMGHTPHSGHGMSPDHPMLHSDSFHKNEG